MMDRLEANRAVAERLTDELVVTGLGNATYDLFRARDRARNFYSWGSMGTAVSVGLGLALARPRERVLVLEGDGALIMGLSGLVSIGRLAPHNLICLIWDNQRLGLTGGQTTATAATADLAGVGRALGFAQSTRVDESAALEAALDAAWRDPGPTLIVARVGLEASGTRPPRRPAALAYRFRRALGTLGPEDALAWD
jgi:thiamine pyrophosphate-dependent acetolactate synthase large subunit-like protein